jgi:hypothetical protein
MAASDNTESTFTWSTLPEVTRVDLPCFTHKDRAFDLLGGETAVGVKIRNNARTIKCQFPTKDHLRLPLEGTSTKSAGMLIRLKPPMISSSATSIPMKDNNDDEAYLLSQIRGTKRMHDEAGSEYEIVGKVMKSFNFDQPSDFQFLPANIGSVDPDLTTLRKFQTATEQDLMAIANPVVIEALPVSFLKTNKSVAGKSVSLVSSSLLSFFTLITTMSMMMMSILTQLPSLPLLDHIFIINHCDSLPNPNPYPRYRESRPF